MYNIKILALFFYDLLLKLLLKIIMLVAHLPINYYILKISGSIPFQPKHTIFLGNTPLFAKFFIICLH